MNRIMLMGCLIFFAQPLFSQCNNNIPGSSESATPKKQLEEIFSGSQKQISKEVSSNKLDQNIVAGKRVKNFELGQSFEAISSQIFMTQSQDNPNYALILPLAYQPKRDFYTMENGKIIFAFSQKPRVVREIFVREANLPTEKGVKIGTSLEQVKKLYKTEVRKNAQDTYVVGPGITFVGKDDVEWIVIFPDTIN